MPSATNEPPSPSDLHVAIAADAAELRVVVKPVAGFLAVILGGFALGGGIILGADYFINGTANSISEVTPMATLSGFPLEGAGSLLSTPGQTSINAGGMLSAIEWVPGQAPPLSTVVGSPLDAPDLGFGVVTISWQFPNTRKENQAIRRGWDYNGINQVINSLAKTLPSPRGNLSTNNNATIYYRNDGHYIILDDVTGDIIQVSDTNDANWLDEGTNNTDFISPK